MCGGPSRTTQALQFDPTLKAEIEYDLKQFERAKKDRLAGKRLPQLPTRCILL